MKLKENPKSRIPLLLYAKRNQDLELKTQCKSKRNTIQNFYLNHEKALSKKRQSNKLRISENTSWRFSELALLWYHVRTQLQQWWRENVVKEREIEWM